MVIKSPLVSGTLLASACLDHWTGASGPFAKLCMLKLMTSRVCKLWLFVLLQHSAGNVLRCWACCLTCFTAVCGQCLQGQSKNIQAALCVSSCIGTCKHALRCLHVWPRFELLVPHCWESNCQKAGLEACLTHRRLHPTHWAASLHTTGRVWGASALNSLGANAPVGWAYDSGAHGLLRLLGESRTFSTRHNDGPLKLGGWEGSMQPNRTAHHCKKGRPTEGDLHLL